MRDKHFLRGGSELNAPGKYIYFEHLDFMREFSLKKEILTQKTVMTTPPSVAPDQLLHEERRDSEASTYIDYTFQFIDVVKEYPELYDEHSELRRYRSKDTWKRISKAMDERFTVGQLRHYWIQLMKKYRVYLDSFHKFHGTIENEEIFDQLSFVTVGIVLKSEHSNELTGLETNKQEQSFDEEHLLVEEHESEDISDYEEEEMDAGGLWMNEPETKKRKRESESEPESEPKKQIVIVETLAESMAEKAESSSKRPSEPPENHDKFYHYGMKTAFELSSLFRDLEQRDRKLAIKAEMEILQVMLKYRESLES